MAKENYNIPTGYQKLNEKDQLALKLGKAMLDFFSLKQIAKVEYLTAGNRKGTEDLTIIVKLPQNRVEYCTSRNLDKVVEMFSDLMAAMVVDMIDGTTLGEDEIPF